MVTAGSELTPGTSVDRRYLIQCTLGRGGFGRTYLAADERRFNELCVLKEFVPGDQVDPVVAQKLRELFQREAAILHKLDHPQIPRFFAGFEENGRLFIAQEYIDGKTYWRMLQERQRRGQAFGQSEVISWLRDLLRVLNYLHQQGIVHRDISPDNIMLPRGGQTPVLIDFGVVKQILPHLHLANPNDPDGLIQASVSVGKFGYAPYEQIRMGQCSPRSDLYALAVTAVVLLTGKPPNLLMDAKTLEWQWQHQVQIDARVREILARMMADRPQDRFASARAVLQGLQPFCQPDAGPVSAKPRRIPKRALAANALPVFSPVHGPADEQDSLAAHATLFEGLSSPPVPHLAPDASAVAAAPQNGKTQSTEASMETYLDLSPMGYSPALPESPTQIELVDQTQLEPTVQGAILAVPSSAWSAAPQTPESRLSVRSLLTLAGELVLRLPQDRLGNARSARFSLRQLALWGVLALLPVGGALVGVRSPHIASLCGVLGNCVGQNLQERYQQVIQQADSAGLLSTSARSLSDLQQARQRLADSIAQLSVFSHNLSGPGSTHTLLSRYQTLLQKLDQALEKETRANSLLNRAEAEAQRASAQTGAAKTYQQYQAAQVEWRRALVTLDAVPEESFVSRQAVARTQEYKARLDALGVKLASLKPATVVTAAATANTRRTTGNAVQVSVVTASPESALSQSAARRSGAARSGSSVQAARSSAQTTAQSSTPAARPQPRPTPARQAGANSRQAGSSARQTARQSPTARAAQPSPQTPSTSPLQVERQWVAGSVRTSATQTLKDVSIWIDGSRTEADGKLVANLWIQNRSSRGFGFVPLYAESRDSRGQTVRSRVLFTGNAGTGNAGTVLEPGKALSGQVYLLDRPSGAANLTLVVQESTEGNRTFRIPL